MELKKFRKEGEQVSRLGFGAWGIGQDMWQGGSDEESLNTLRKAIEGGITLYDSALVYGRGKSEHLIGKVEKELGKELFVTSKIPSKLMQWPAKDDALLKDSFPTDYIIKMTEKSLRNYKRDYLDLMQFHVWNDAWAEQDEWKEAIFKLKEQGKVRYFGISMNDHQPENGIKAAASGMIDSFQVIFNIFDQSPTDTLLNYCSEKDIAVIARVPFDEGSLAGAVNADTVFPENDWRNDYFKGDRKRQVAERVARIKADISGECASIAEAALRYLISFDAVTAVIPGMRKEKNLHSNLNSVAKGALSAELMEKLKSHRWDRNFYETFG